MTKKKKTMIMNMVKKKRKKRTIIITVMIRTVTVNVMQIYPACYLFDHIIIQNICRFT